MKIDDFAKTDPPWVMFPDMQPEDLRATQGMEEIWLTEIWWPFWLDLTENERDQHLLRWQATEPWREHLDFHTRSRENFDEAADATESAQYHASKQQATKAEAIPARHWLWRWLFRTK